MTTIEKERARVEAVNRYRILDSEREGNFDRITALAASILGVPHAVVSLADVDRLWFKSVVGLEAEEVPRASGLCERALTEDRLFHLEDARLDPVASRHPLVDTEDGIRFYAGIALRTSDGFAIGILCVFGPTPRGLSESECAWLEQLAEFTMHEIESRRMRLELKHTEEALLKAQRLGSIGLIASGVAHDFNNLLGGIIGNVELLREEVEPGSVAAGLVDEVCTVARRSSELVGQVLAFAGREDEPHGPFDLNALVEQTRYMLESVVSENTRLELDLTSDSVVVDCNAASIRQLIMNLVTNASEAYEGEAGVVSLATRLDGDQACLTVEDRGVGLEPSVREHMFEPLFTTKDAGRGLGLAVVKRILDTEGTSIDVQSEAGVGTKITVSMSASDAELGANAEPTSALTSTPGDGSILVIDDEQAILNVTRRILSRAEYKVICALGGPDGIDLLQEHKDSVCAVLLDMSMPVMSGEETLVELRRIAPDLKVILSSGHTEEQARTKFSGHEIDGFLKKPYGLGELLKMVEEVAGA